MGWLDVRAREDVNMLVTRIPIATEHENERIASRRLAATVTVSPLALSMAKRRACKSEKKGGHLRSTCNEQSKIGQAQGMFASADEVSNHEGVYVQKKSWWEGKAALSGNADLGQLAPGAATEDSSKRFF